MDIAFLYSLGAVLLVSLASLAGIFALLLTGKFLERVIFVLVSLSVGVLFGDVFVHILPEIYETEYALFMPFYVLGGITLFFVLEKFLRWGHAHEHHGHHIHDIEQCEEGGKTVGLMVLFADGLHNLIDGIIITVSFMVSVEVGIATVIAVLLHEIPQEIGDFGILLHAKYSRSKALLYNFFSALASFAGLGIAYALGGSIEGFTTAALAFAAGGFIYIAGSDLVPELHKSNDVKRSFVQFASILAGFSIMFALLALE